MCLVVMFSTVWFQFPAGSIDAANLIELLENTVKVTIRIRRDGTIGELTMRICRADGKITIIASV